MKIGIDARLIDETGVGRYIRNLIQNLGETDTKHRYVVFLRKKSYSTFRLPNARWEKRLADVPWHTMLEQLVMPWFYLRERVDLVHIPYFNIPIFYPKAFVVTIHDLIILHFNTGKATTLPIWRYQIRRFGYWLILKIGLHRAKFIIAVSQTTKKEIVSHFHVPEANVVVTYEGVDSKIYKSANDKSTNINRLITEQYFLYVGNAYPHKNIEVLLKAFEQIPTHCKLVLVGRNDFFYQRLREKISSRPLRDRVVFFGEANDDQLSGLYAHAVTLVFPSLMEGFGLPPLEALASGCRVIASEIPVFREILGDLPRYVDSSDATQLAQAMIDSLHQTPDKQWAQRARDHAKRFRWVRMAEKTQAVYERSIGV